MLQKFVDSLIEHLTATIAAAATTLTGVLLAPQMKVITEAFEKNPRELTLWTIAVFLIGTLFGYVGLLNSKTAEQFLRIKRSCRTLSQTQRALLLKLLNEGPTIAGNEYDVDLLCKAGLLIASDVPNLFGTAAMISPDAIDILQRHRTDWIGKMSEEEIAAILKN